MAYLDRIDLVALSAELERQKEAKSPDYDAVIAAQNLPDTQLPGNSEIDEHLPGTQLPDYLEIDDDHLQDTQLHDNPEVDEEPEPGSPLVPRPDVPLIATSPHNDNAEAQLSDESQSASMPPRNAPQTTSGPSTQAVATSSTRNLSIAFSYAESPNTADDTPERACSSSRRGQEDAEE
ncbi:hypothetical protein V7S43_017522 [Phytophthora oleae]|uniref:Uncharacterized protein n=1 Tax=Phytophthora oleae TaxID=2107226 RepID=A0ABD3EST4_9STRA